MNYLRTNGRRRETGNDGCFGKGKYIKRVAYYNIYMAGKTKYEMAVEALKPFDGKILHVNELKMIIMRKLASSEPAVRGYCRLIETMGITKEVEHYKFKIDCSNEFLTPSKSVDDVRPESERGAKDFDGNEI